MKKYILIVLIALGCKKVNTPTNNNVTVPDEISGVVQKGPFTAGSSLTLFELDNQFNPTGSIFNTQVTDDKGTFVFNTTGLNSRYCILKADGYYFNEDQAFISNSPLTLYSLCDVADTATRFNVNVLTHLIKPRIEYLIQNGNTLQDSKKQAQAELLHVFGLSKPDIKAFENLDIIMPGDDNALLLAISLIVQGSNYSIPFGNFDGNFSELLTNIANDIKTDGVLNNDPLLYRLLNNSFLIRESAVHTNLSNRYSQLGQTIANLDIRKYVDSFITQTSLRLDGNSIYFPDKVYDSNYNILRLTDFDFYGNPSQPNISTLLMNVYVPLNTTLSVRIEEIDSLSHPTGLISNLYDIVGVGNSIDPTATHSKLVVFPNLSTLYHIDLAKGYSYKLKYFINGSTTPTIDREISVQ
ncbi:MAG: hypothetical protein ABIN36_19505 [Ferruginibacter sp.]